jgi:pyruvate kinase
MSHVCETTEAYLDTIRTMREPLRVEGQELAAAVANGVGGMVHDLRVRLVAIYSLTGATARVFSKARFSVPIVAMSSDARSLRRMALQWAVIPQRMPPPADASVLLEGVDQLAQQLGLAESGDLVIVVAGSSLGTPGVTNSVLLHTVGSPGFASVPLDAANGSGKTSA